MELEIIIRHLKKMGCLCFKASVEVEGVRYKVIRHIADGGFSSVQLVENTRNGKRYAVKRITCHSIEDQNLAKNEIDINRKFSDHPNIVSLIGAELDGNADIVHDVTSEVIMVFPYYEVGPLQSSQVFATLHDVCSEGLYTTSWRGGGWPPPLCPSPRWCLSSGPCVSP